MKNEIEVYDKCSDISSIQVLGEAIATSGMFGCENKSQGTILALQCITERKPPLELSKTYHIIKGKLSKRADAMLADFRKAGGKWKWSDLKNQTQQLATVEFEDQTHEVGYTIEEAKQAGLVKAAGNWDRFPAAMLRARLVSETLRAIAPEIVQGAYTPEEISDFDDKPIKRVDEADMSRAEKVVPIKKAEGAKQALAAMTVAMDEEQLDGDHPRDRLRVKLEPHAEMANEYLRKKGRIEQGQVWTDAPQITLLNIEENLPLFLRTIGVDV